MFAAVTKGLCGFFLELSRNSYFVGIASIRLRRAVIFVVFDEMGEEADFDWRPCWILARIGPVCVWVWREGEGVVGGGVIAC